MDICLVQFECVPILDNENCSNILNYKLMIQHRSRCMANGKSKMSSNSRKRKYPRFVAN
uniref:Uncharacterized protein n=1 Tax=Arundo donax TaxID=35708 RepID=A0A0A8ZB27_ARUDO